jgi:hypothetical protein
MRHHALLLAIVILMAGYAVGQTPRRAIEQGKIEELKGLTNVFVISPGRDQSLAGKVTETIQKKLPGLNFVDSPADAEIWLSVFAGTASESTRVLPESTRVPTDLNRPPNVHGGGQPYLSYERVPAVRGSVMIRRAGKLRRIAEFSKTTGGKSRMAEDFAKEFIRIYQKALVTP